MARVSIWPLSAIFQSVLPVQNRYQIIPLWLSRMHSHNRCSNIKQIYLHKLANIFIKNPCKSRAVLLLFGDKLCKIIIAFQRLDLGFQGQNQSVGSGFFCRSVPVLCRGSNLGGISTRIRKPVCKVEEEGRVYGDVLQTEVPRNHPHLVPIQVGEEKKKII